MNNVVIPVKKSTLCVFKDALIAKNVTNPDWLKSNTIQDDDSKKSYLLLEHPHELINQILNQLRLLAMTRAYDVSSSKTPVPLIKINDRNHFLCLDRVVTALFQDKKEKFLPKVENFDQGIGFVESAIIGYSTEWETQIKTWICSVQTDKERKVKLVYRASKDGWSTSEFHSKCDNEGPTLTIVKTDKGYVFGGYSNRAWFSAQGSTCHSSNSQPYCSNIRSDNAFLFSLYSGATKDRAVKIGIRQNSNAICNSYAFGPTFGRQEEFDLQVGNYNDMKSGYTKIGGSYGGSDNNYILNGHSLVGNSTGSFTAVEVEVFRV